MNFKNFPSKTFIAKNYYVTQRKWAKRVPFLSWEQLFSAND